MTCKSCGSSGPTRFNGELAIHFPELKGLNLPVVWVFPSLLVCLTCGFAELKVPEEELMALAKNDSASSG